MYYSEKEEEPSIDARYENDPYVITIMHFQGFAVQMISRVKLAWDAARANVYSHSRFHFYSSDVIVLYCVEVQQSEIWWDILFFQRHGQHYCRRQLEFVNIFVLLFATNAKQQVSGDV